MMHFVSQLIAKCNVVAGCLHADNGDLPVNGAVGCQSSQSLNLQLQIQLTLSCGTYQIYGCKWNDGLMDFGHKE